MRGETKKKQNNACFGFQGVNRGFHRRQKPLAGNIDTYMKHTKKQLADLEKQEQVAKLRAWFPKGSTVYCTVQSVSRSGMSRVISIQGYRRSRRGKVILDENTGEPWQVFPNYAASVVLGWPLVRGSKDGVRAAGCGMNMCRELVYTLSYAIHGDGDALKHS